MAKTNKSFTKRIRVTPSGKLKIRKAGGNHFNAKESSSKQTNRRVPMGMTMKPKALATFLPGLVK